MSKTKSYIFLIFLALIQGNFCGLIGAMFSKSITFVTNLREQNSWIIFGLVIAGIITVFVFKRMKTENYNTETVIKSANGERFVSILLLPSVFIGTVLTHLCGGSAGREGAALQMGGATAALFTKIFGLDDEQQRVLTVSGMAGFFSALFGTPFGAAIFSIEVIRFNKKTLKLIIPTVISSITAFGIALLLKTESEHFFVGDAFNFEIVSIIKIFVIAVLVALFGIVFCKSLKFSKYIFKKYLKNPYIRISVGGIAIVALSFLVGTNDYNGGGINVIERIFNDNTVRYEAFILKLIFTLITVSAGFKGGEIVPTFYMGATLGATIAALLSFSLPIGAAVGMTALFCAVTKCPFATFVLALELFGFGGGVIYLAVSLIAYFVSGRCNLYDIDKNLLKIQNL